MSTGLLRYDLLGLDLDGTLLDARGRVSEANCEALRRARAAGLRVVVATGRGLVECRHICEQIEQVDPVVVAGGAITADPVSGRTVDRVVMPAAMVSEAVAMIHREGHAALVLKDPDAAGFDYLVLTSEAEHALDPATVRWFEMLPVEARFCATLEQDPCPEATVRVGTVAGVARSAGVRRHLEESFGGRATLHCFDVTYGPEQPGGGQRATIIEVFNIEANKWSALTRVASRFGVDRSRIAAIGDEVNDMAMLEGAACGIAMGNGVESIRAAAEHVAPSNDESGVAYAIDRLLAGAW